MKDIHVQITGIHNEDDFVKTDIDNVVNVFIQKVGDFFKQCKPCEQSLEIVIKKHNDSGGNDRRIKYSVHARMQTPAGLILAESNGFGKLVTIVKDTLNKLEGEIKKKHDKLVSK